MRQLHEYIHIHQMMLLGWMERDIGKTATFQFMHEFESFQLNSIMISLWISTFSFLLFNCYLSFSPSLSFSLSFSLFLWLFFHTQLFQKLKIMSNSLLLISPNICRLLNGSQMEWNYAEKLFKRVCDVVDRIKFLFRWAQMPLISFKNSNEINDHRTKAI